jgi:uncharacterized damage-inducible protein DinB
MDLNEYRRLFAYNGWANCETLNSLRIATSVSPDAVKRLAHILSAEKLWLERLQQKPQTSPVWPVSTIDACDALASEMSASWQTYLTDLATKPNSLDATFEYRNSKGEPWSSKVADVLTHVLFHAAYHRGQVALQIRASGAEPAYTDFIHAVRQGLLG